MTAIEALRERFGAWRWMLLVAAAQETGIFRALAAEPLGVDDLAQRLQLDRRATYVVLEALVAGDFAEAADGRYRLSEAARRLLVAEDDPAYLAPSVLHSRDLASRWLRLPEILRGSRPEGPRLSTPANFTATMAIGARALAPIVVERCLARFPNVRHVLDVGGGPGVHADAFLAKGRAVTILDVPAVIELAKARWAGRREVTLVPGDFTVDLPPGPFDLAFLGNVCHIYGPEENRRLFQRVAAVLAPGGGIAILDFVRGRSTTAALFGVNMLAVTASGGTWTEDEYAAWLAGAGFGDIVVEDVGASPQERETRQRQLILARIAKGETAAS